jgi:hypothetical protein
VELVLHGVDAGQEWAPYGGWAAVAHGHVPDDGSRIVTDRDSGLPTIGTVGIRRR